MKRFPYLMMVIVFLLLIPGCGSDRDKGTNSPNKRNDLPRAAPPETTPSKGTAKDKKDEKDKKDREAVK